MSRIYSHRYMVFTICLFAFMCMHQEAKSQCTATGLISNAFSDPDKGNTITVDLDWDDVAGAEAYQVNYKLSGGVHLYSNTLTSSEVSFFNLEPDTLYYWRVNVKCNGVWSGWPAFEEQFSTPGGVACQATGLSSSVYADPDLSNTIVAQLDWDALPVGEAYQVNYKILGGAQQYTPVLTSNSAMLYTLQPNTTYTWRVKVKCNGVWNSWPDFVEQFTTPSGTACEATNLAAEVDEDPDTGVISATLSWDLLEFADQYQVNYIHAGGTHQYSPALTGNSFVATNLVEGATYFWRVRVMCNGAWNNWPSFEATFQTTPPDLIPPVVITQDITRSLDEFGDLTIVATDVDNGSFDETSEVTLSLDITEFDCTHVGPNVVTLTVTDEAGNSGVGTATVTVVDDTPPIALANDLTVSLSEGGSIKISPDDIDNGSNDTCGIASLDLSQMSFDCTHVGENLVDLMVTDVNGNSATAQATVTVVDDVAPVVTASIDLYEQHHKRKYRHHPHNIYQVNYAATDGCNDQQDVEGIILLPDLEGYQVKLKRIWFGQKIKIDSKKKKMYVYARRPMALYESIVEKGGIKVFNESYSYMRLTDGHKYEYKMIAGWLFAVTAPHIELQATATDASGNTAQANYVLGETLYTDPASRTADPIATENSEVEELLTIEPQVYPVPSTGTFNMSFDGSNFGPEAKISMYSVSGTLVDQKNLSWQNATIQVGNEYLKEGIYLIKVEGLNANYTKRVVVKRN